MLEFRARNAQKRIDLDIRLQDEHRVVSGPWTAIGREVRPEVFTLMQYIFRSGESETEVRVSGGVWNKDGKLGKSLGEAVWSSASNFSRPIEDLPDFLKPLYDHAIATLNNKESAE